MPYNPVAFKERDLRRAVRAAGKEGLIVSGFEIEPSGTIRIHMAPPDHPPAQSAAIEAAPGSAAYQRTPTRAARAPRDVAQ
jgi:hypothetical protein